MLNRLMLILMSLVITSSIYARTAIDCTMVQEMRPDLVKACYDQTSDWLNDNYQLLLNKSKYSRSQINDLKTTQRVWLQSLDAQCKRPESSVSSAEVVTELKCAVVMMRKRAEALEKMVSDAENLK